MGVNVQVHTMVLSEGGAYQSTFNPALAWDLLQPLISISQFNIHRGKYIQKCRFPNYKTPNAPPVQHTLIVAPVDLLV